jgi:hypothetical protein
MTRERKKNIKDMDINRDNYEGFFLDFAEGNLSAAQEEILNNFLKFNPDLAEELKAFDLLKVVPEDIMMPAKKSLKKEIPTAAEAISEHNFEMYSIAYLENDLTEYQRSLFEGFISRDEKYQADFSLMKKTVLQTEAIPFPHKSRLRKRSKAVINLRIILPFAAAAAIALLLLVRADFLSIEPEIAAVPENATPVEVLEIKAAAEKPPLKEKSTSIQIIRNSRTQVPVSNIKNRASVTNSKNETAKTNQKEIKRIAGVNLSQPHLPEVKIKEDQIVPVAQPLPNINMSSLAIADRVRYQMNKASEILDDDDVFIWNLASQGIEEINKRAGTDMSLIASQDQEGSVSGFRFKSRLLNVSAPISSDRY